MISPGSFLFRELPLISKIIADETWLEGERRHCPVQPHDPVVQERACDIILKVGQQLRDSLQGRESDGRA